MELDPRGSFDTFPWDTEVEYQAGLQAMLQSGALEGKSDVEKDKFLLSTRLFYFNRLSGSSLTAADVMTEGAHAQVPSAPAIPEPTSTEVSAPAHSSSSAPNAPSEARVLSFAEIKELIEQGRTDQIPNNRVIPDQLSTETPSETKSPLRKKPWEA